MWKRKLCCYGIVRGLNSVMISLSLWRMAGFLLWHAQKKIGHLEARLRMAGSTPVPNQSDSHSRGARWGSDHMWSWGIQLFWSSYLIIDNQILRVLSPFGKKPWKRILRNPLGVGGCRSLCLYWVCSLLSIQVGDRKVPWEAAWAPKVNRENQTLLR